MKLLFVSLKPFYPETSGGAQLSSLLLFQRLQDRGWEIEVLSGIHLTSLRLRRHIWHHVSRLRQPGCALLDHDLGFPCWRRQIYPFLPDAKSVIRRRWEIW